MTPCTVLNRVDWNPIFCISFDIRYRPPVPQMFPSRKRLICCPLSFAHFHGFHRYYGAVRLLAEHLALSTWLALIAIPEGFCKISQVHLIYIVCSPRSKTPAEKIEPCNIGSALLPATSVRVSASALPLSRLNRFTYVAARILPCLRLVLTSRLHTQGWVLAGC